MLSSAFIILSFALWIACKYQTNYLLNKIYKNGMSFSGNYFFEENI